MMQHFFNMCRPLELVFHNGKDKGVQIGPKTGEVEDMKTFEEFYHAYKVQMDYAIKLLVNADNAIDVAHAQRCPLPFLSSMVDDCMKRGKSVQEGGAVYNFTGPQGFGVANMADALYAVKTLVYDEKKITMKELKRSSAYELRKRLKRGRCIGHHQRNRTRDAGNRRDSQRTYSGGDLKKCNRCFGI